MPIEIPRSAVFQLQKGFCSEGTRSKSRHWRFDSRVGVILRPQRMGFLFVTQPELPGSRWIESSRLSARKFL